MPLGPEINFKVYHFLDYITRASTQMPIPSAPHLTDA